MKMMSHNKNKTLIFFRSVVTLEVKLELWWGTTVLLVLVVKLPSLFSITVIVCTLPPLIIALVSASGIPSLTGWAIFYPLSSINI